MVDSSSVRPKKLFQVQTNIVITIAVRFSPALQLRHDELSALKAEAQKLQASLIKKYGEYFQELLQGYLDILHVNVFQIRLL